MKKILFILLFLIAVSPLAYADDDFRTDVLGPGYVPSETTSVKEKSHKKIFSRKNKVQKKVSEVKRDVSDEKQEAAEDAAVLKKETKSEAKKEKKNKKDNKNKKNNKKTEVKNNSNIKELNNLINDAEKEYKLTPAVNDYDNEDAVKDAAYTGSVNTTRILDVNQCVKTALENHPQILYAMGNAEVLKSKIAQAWSAYFPTFSAGISYSKNDMQLVNFAVPSQKYDMYYTPTVSGNMLLFDFGKTKAQADYAKRNYESAKYALENTINNVIFNVKSSYYNLLFAQQQVKVYEDTVKDYTLHLEQANAYYVTGKKAKIDVLTAEQNLGNAKLNLIQANNTLKIAYVQLSNAMGLSEEAEPDFDVKDNLATKAYDINMQDAVKTAFETSPELLAAKKKADAAELALRASRRAFTPDVSGFASYSRGGKRVDTDYGYQIGAQLNYSTVNLLQLKKQVDEAKAVYKRDFAEYENVKQNIHYSVKEAYFNLVNSQESINVAKLTMVTAKEQYDLAAGRYKAGLGDAIELKDAETTYRNAQLNYFNSLLTYHVSAADLERIIGSPIAPSDNDLL